MVDYHPHSTIVLSNETRLMNATSENSINPKNNFHDYLPEIFEFLFQIDVTNIQAVLPIIPVRSELQDTLLIIIQITL